MGFEINERIQVFIDALNITPYEFSKRIGNKRPDGLYKILDKKTKPSPKTLDKISETFPNLNMNWLLNGEGNLLKEGRNRLIGSAEDDVKGEGKKEDLHKAEDPEPGYGDVIRMHQDLKKDLAALAEGMTHNFEVVSRGVVKTLQGQKKILEFIDKLDPEEIKHASKGLNKFLEEH